MVWIVVGLLIVGYMVVWPTVEKLFESRRVLPTISRSDDLSLARSMQIRAVLVFSAMWFLILGGAFGSFLNVVAASLPRGETILLRSSRCPNCAAPIWRRDNIPIVGYLILGGRCRACQIPISPRYLIVEMITATMFMLFFVVELISGGGNLPERSPNLYTGILWIVLDTKWDLVGIYAYHMAMLCTLLTGALMLWDGFEIRRSWKIALAIGFLLPTLFWPMLHVVPVHQTLTNWESHLGSWRHGVTPLVGGVVGYCVARLLSRLTNALPTAERYRGLALVGIVMGWQGAVGAALVNLVLEGLWVAASGSNRRSGHAHDFSFTLIASGLELLAWRWLYEKCGGWWPTAQSNLVQIGSFGAALVCVALVLRSLHSRPILPETTEQALQSSL
jgi:leader peptidase (prepilin peptidase)/N-methyltransferase